MTQRSWDLELPLPLFACKVTTVYGRYKIDDLRRNRTGLRGLAYTYRYWTFYDIGDIDIELPLYGLNLIDKN